MIITKHEAAMGNSFSSSGQLTLGRPNEGSPPGTGPTTAMPRAAKSHAKLAVMAPTTTNSGNGNCGRKWRETRMPPTTTAEIASVGR